MSNNWVVVKDIGSDEDSSWSKASELDQKTEDEAWKVKASILNPNVTDPKFSRLGFGGWTAEEFAFLPEDVTTAPEDTQADSTSWTISPEPS